PHYPVRIGTGPAPPAYSRRTKWPAQTPRADPPPQVEGGRKSTENLAVMRLPSLAIRTADSEGQNAPTARGHGLGSWGCRTRLHVLSCVQWLSGDHSRCEGGDGRDDRDRQRIPISALALLRRRFQPHHRRKVYFRR